MMVKDPKSMLIDSALHLWCIDTSGAAHDMGQIAVTNLPALLTGMSRAGLPFTFSDPPFRLSKPDHSGRLQ